MSRRFSFAALAVLVVGVTACGTRAPADAGPAGGAQQAPPQAPKILTMAIQAEPSTVGVSFGDSSVAGGAANVKAIVHDGLGVEYLISDWRPLVAVELPSLERGTWRINPDGTMDTTFQIRPNVKWHDGTPLTMSDVLFSLDVFTDPQIAHRSAAKPLISSFAAADDSTVTLHWSRTYVYAAEASGADGLTLLPKHLLEATYRADRDAFLNSPFQSTEFVGLGPYRLVRWDRGSQIEFARFDDYYRGRPPLDRVIVKQIGDPNAAIANILAGAVDIVLPTGGTADLDAALEVKQRWEGTGNQVRIDAKPQFEQMEIQHHPEYARPINGMTVRDVREALYRTIDRPALAEVMTHGLAPVADSWLTPNDPLRPHVESSIPQYPYDLARAQQLMTQAGWVRGGDGVLVHQGTGDRFDIEIRGNAGPGTEKEMNAIADGWKAIGARVELNLIPPARQGDAESEATRSGPRITSPSADLYYQNRLHSNQMATAANRFTGRNRGNYNNPQLDVLLDRMNATIDPQARINLHRQLLQLQMGDMAVYPLFWEVAPILMVKGVTGPRAVRNQVTANIFEWDKE